MSKLDKLRRDPETFFSHARSPVARVLGLTAVKTARYIALNPSLRELQRNPVKFFEQATSPSVRAVGVVATKALPALRRVAGSVVDPHSTTLRWRRGAHSDQPLVSVIMATHNAELTIGRALESVLRQTHHNLEILVIDDASTDATGDIVEEVAEQDPRIVIVRNRRLHGAPQARNQGLSMAAGRYAVFHDATELAHPDRIARQVSELAAHPDSFVCTVSRRDARGRTSRKAPVSMMFRREPVLERIGYLRAGSDSDRQDYYVRIGRAFGDEAARTLAAQLCEGQTPPVSFEYADGQKVRVNPIEDERAVWPSPTWQPGGDAAQDQDTGDYVAYRPPVRRYVELHATSRHPDVRGRILFA